MYFFLLGEHQSKISELEMLLAKLNETVHNLENKKSSSEAIEETYKTKLELLETQLSSAQSAHRQDNEKLKKITVELDTVSENLNWQEANREVDVTWLFWEKMKWSEKLKNISCYIKSREY